MENKEVALEEKRIAQMIDMIEAGNIKLFLGELDQMAASKAYLVIRDNVQQRHIKMIRESGKDNYQLYQDIKSRAKQSWDYDHRVPIMLDINRACMNVYTLVLRLMKAHNDDTAAELNAIKSAINRIEEKIGIEPTVWDIDSTNDGGDSDVSNEQGVKENI